MPPLLAAVGVDADPDSAGEQRHRRTELHRRKFVVIEPDIFYHARCCGREDGSAILATGGGMHVDKARIKQAAQTLRVPS